MKLVIFIHAAITGRCSSRLEMYLNTIYKSGLYDNVEKIFIDYVGSDSFPMLNINFDIDNKIIYKKISNNLDTYELLTLSDIYKFCVNNKEYNVLYIHTKGITGDINICIEDWVSYMIYFLITKWKNCIELLDFNDTVGVDLRNYPTLHYSGNFWWASANHIRSLPDPIVFNNLEKYPNPLNSIRHNQEFWICYLKDSKKYVSLWDCGINCFERHLHRYPSNMHIL